MGYRVAVVAEECPLKNHNQCQKKPTTLKGPVRVIRLCLLGIILPTMLISIPLYLRYRVYNIQLYPLAMSDMRLIDSKVSTTWCQRQLVKVNTTFNAFLLPQPPTISRDRRPLSMVRHLILEDDMKEYWGFYLLAGSSVTVSTCVRWPGASLIVIRGHKHLHECAYIGDDSSEELDEILEAIRGRVYSPSIPKNVSHTPDAPPNDPDLMKRHRADVQFHHHTHNSSKNHTIPEKMDVSDISNTEDMRKILNLLQAKSAKNSRTHNSLPPSHVHRNSTIATGEDENVKIKSASDELGASKADDVVSHIIGKLKKLGKDADGVLDEVNNRFKTSQTKDPFLQHTFDVKGRHYSKPAIKYDDNIDKVRRRKRELILSTAAVLNQDTEDENLGIEQGFTPDGIADHRGTINETTLNDKSDSEFWSSFSSSEEALLNCAGLILNLPLTPHHKCDASLREANAEEPYSVNTITYKVPVNGYYFFVFNSENEVQPNYIRVNFHLDKSIYNVSNPVSTCTNSSSTCSLDLKFFSSETVVMELPVSNNESLWNEEFVVLSECEPRSAMYATCIIAIPVVVILFAFS